MTSVTATRIAAATGFLAVGLGAFGAHGLREVLIQNGTTAIWEKAVFYHFIHALGMLIVSIIPRTGALAESSAGLVNWLLLAGIVFFSGSLYGMALTGMRVLGAITPIGGLSFIAAWLTLAWFMMRHG